MPLRNLLCAAFCACAFHAAATPQFRNVTDMWFDPAESGWGLNLIHQGDTLFATLFVYGNDGQPRWFVASGLTGGGGTGASSFSGTLRECMGPWFGGPFNARPVQCRDVGSMHFTATDSGGSVDYLVDGVHVVKQVQRFTFKATSLAGTYAGSRYQPQPVVGREIAAMTIEESGATVTMSTQGDSGPCSFTGNHGQDGQYEIVSGTYGCGSRTGPWSMRVDPMPAGFVGTFLGDGIDAPSGRIAASRTDFYQYRGNGWRNDMWFQVDESGWGLNLIEQGSNSDFTLFATLFTYDPQGRPRWYVASDLARHDIAGDWVYYLGELYETTGPYFGTSFNPAAVTTRRVGTIGLATHTDNRPAQLNYSVDGVSVQKMVTRFAFRKNDFSGTYSGHLQSERDDTAEDMTFTIADGATFTMQAAGASGTTCTYSAPAAQQGHMRIMNGTYSCSGGASGTFSMSNALVSFHGFTARLRRDGFVVGNLEGARR
jgi:hypothetical protein